MGAEVKIICCTVDGCFGGDSGADGRVMIGGSEVWILAPADALSLCPPARHFTHLRTLECEWVRGCINVKVLWAPNGGGKARYKLRPFTLSEGQRGTGERIGWEAHYSYQELYGTQIIVYFYPSVRTILTCSCVTPSLWGHSYRILFHTFYLHLQQ